MLPLQSYNGFKNSLLNVEDRNTMKPVIIDGADSTIFSSGTSSVTKSTAASKSHKEAERRRRQRINAHLSTLRTLLPNKTKTDKASLLAEVVQHLKELKKRFADVVDQQDSNSCYSTGVSDSGSKPALLFPSETDQVKLSYCDRDVGNVKAVLCCEDRPGLNQELAQALQLVRTRAVKGEIATVGGRTKTVLVVQCGGECGRAGENEIGTLNRALKAVVENRGSSSN